MSATKEALTELLVKETRQGIATLERVRPLNGRSFLAWCFDIANELAAVDTAVLANHDARRKAGLE